MPQSPEHLLGPRWFVTNDGHKLLIRRRSGPVRRFIRSSLVIITLLLACGLGWMWAMSTPATGIVYVQAIVAFLAVFLLFGLAAEVRGEAFQIALFPNRLKIVVGGLFHSKSMSIAVEDVAYVYAKKYAVTDDTSDRTHFVIGYVDARMPVWIEVCDSKDCGLLAEIIRQHYDVPEFPPSGAAHSMDLFCLNCRYDMRWSMTSMTLICPECGTKLASWQVEDWQTWSNRRLRLTGGDRDGQ